MHSLIIHNTGANVKHMFVSFQEKRGKFFRLSTTQRENHGQRIKTGVQRFNESPPAARRKGDPQAAQRGCLFRGGAFCRCPVFVALFLETAVLLHCLRRLVFELKRGVSLSAAARSAAALVYDKLTPNCQELSILLRLHSITKIASSFFTNTFIFYLTPSSSLLVRKHSTTPVNLQGDS